MIPVRKPLPNESHRKHEAVCICYYCRFIMLVKVIAVDAVSPTRTIHVALSPPDTSPIPSYPIRKGESVPEVEVKLGRVRDFFIDDGACVAIA